MASWACWPDLPVSPPPQISSDVFAPERRGKGEENCLLEAAESALILILFTEESKSTESNFLALQTEKLGLTKL